MSDEVKLTWGKTENDLLQRWPKSADGTPEEPALSPVDRLIREIQQIQASLPPRVSPPSEEEAAFTEAAEEQYDAIGNEEYETERLRRLFAAFECTAELNAELLQSTVSAVLVTRQTVRLQLKNGQIIGKDDLV